jgi:DNA polymerase-3 subunit chi
VRAGSRIVVTAEADVLRELDVALWTFSPLEFIPHCGTSAGSVMAGASPVMLTGDARGSPHSQVLVNLGEHVPAGFDRFERLIEVVTLDDADRQQARGRWKHYTDLGYAIVRHDLNLKG